jgi:hypothetical protein
MPVSARFDDCAHAVRGRALVAPARALAGLFVLSAAIIAGCGSTGGPRPPVAAGPGTAPATVGSASLTFRLDGVMPTAAPASTKRAPSFLSPATASLTIDIKTVGGGVEASGYPVTVPLSVTSSSCTSSQLTYSCQINAPNLLASVAYTASLSTADASGSVLSSASTTFTLTANTANVIGLTLAGIPHAIQVSSASANVVGSAAGGLTLYGASPQPITVNAVDVDGDLIIGPGAPTFTVSAASSTGWTVATPAPTTPNTIVITPPGTNRAAQSFSAVATSGGCSAAGAACSTNFVVRNDIQTLFVMDSSDGNVKAYTLPLTPSSTPSVAISSGVSQPRAIVADALGNLYVANDNDTVTGYAPPYTGSPSVTIANGISSAVALAADRFGHLFVSNAGSSLPSITEYAPPNAASSPIATMTLPYGIKVTSMATDVAGDLFITRSGSPSSPPPAQFQEYAPSAPGAVLGTTALVTATTYGSGQSFGNPADVVVDASGNVYVMDSSLGLALQFAAPYTTNAAVFLSGGYGAVPLATTPSGLIVTTNGPSSIQFVIASDTLVSKLYSGFTSPFAFAVDGTGTLYAANANSVVSAVAVPYTATPLQVTSSGIGTNPSTSLNPLGQSPQTLAITP